ncbi:unnamed protein product [Ixodes pacificus]
MHYSALMDFWAATDGSAAFLLPRRAARCAGHRRTRSAGARAAAAAVPGEHAVVAHDVTLDRRTGGGRDVFVAHARGAALGVQTRRAAARLLDRRTGLGHS